MSEDDPRRRWGKPRTRDVVFTVIAAAFLIGVGVLVVSLAGICIHGTIR